MPFNIILGVIFILFILWVIKKLVYSTKLDKFVEELASPGVNRDDIDEVIDHTKKNLNSLAEIEKKNCAERKALKDENKSIQSFQDELKENSDQD